MLDTCKQRLVVGMDGGGTSTKVCVLDESGREVLNLKGGSLNVNGIGSEGVLKSMAGIFSALADKGVTAERVAGICIGAAGISNPLTARTLKQGVGNAGIAAAPVLLGDHQVALYGAHGTGRGMILISGTGSICYGVDGAGNEARAGGWGHLIDDGGSAYAIGRDVLSAVVQAEDGRIPPTCMRHAVFEKTGTSDIRELIGYVYSDGVGKKEIAALAPIVGIGLCAGEAAAVGILERAAQMLAELVYPVAEKLHMEAGELALCGSTIGGNDALAKRLGEILGERLPQLRCIPPKHDAAYGAALRCLEKH